MSDLGRLVSWLLKAPRESIQLRVRTARRLRINLSRVCPTCCKRRKENRRSAGYCAQCRRDLQNTFTRPTKRRVKR